MLRIGFLALIGFVWQAGGAAVPTPAEHLGYEPGADYKLADYAEVTGYFKKLAAASDRIKLEEFGKSAEGKPIYVAFLSSAENLSRLHHWRDISARLALGAATPEEARKLAAEGKAVVWIDSGLHASEVAPVQHSFDLAYRMVAAEDPETRRIRDNVILMQVPVINPDGLDWIVHWYRRNVGTPYELAPLPRLYQKYAGHDNNRDWFMLNLPETRAASRLLFREWYPHIVYNQHQSPAFPARIFVPPYAEPLNPNIPAAVMEGIHTIGSAMKERFARENKPGVLSYLGFDAWWNGGLRSSPAFHNMHGILTETALFGYGTPGQYQEKDLPERFSNGIPTKEPTVFYQRPWLGGKWGTRDAIEYMLTADFAILDLAASRSEHFLYKSWALARAAIEAGSNGALHAYVIPADQWDMSAATDMVRRLRWSGIEVQRARKPFRIGDREYPADSFVIPAGQPFRAYLVDLMEPHKYPELKTGDGKDTKRPYDVAGWTMSMTMGVDVVRVKDRFQADLEQLSEVALPRPSSDPRQNSSFLDLAQALAAGARREWKTAAERYEVRAPRVALYEPYTANMDAGWTQYLLDEFRVPYTVIHNSDVAKDDLRTRFDVILFASQSATSILHGARAGEASGRERTPGDMEKSVQRPEYTGGIGVAGLASVDRFVRAGGTLIAFDDATELPIDFFPLALKKTNGASTDFYCPGSVVRIEVDQSHPMARGMPKHTYALMSGGPAWDVSLIEEFNKGDRAIRSVVKYASKDVLASGWLSGEKTIAGKHAMIEARHGNGRVVLFGFRPQFRAQTAATFKLVLNAIYLASAKSL